MMSMRFWKSEFSLSAIVLFLASSILLFPIDWHPNEINYFVLSEHFLFPERFVPYSAVFGETKARFLSFVLIGLLEEIFGESNSIFIFRIIIVIGLSYSISLLARVFKLRTSDTLFSLLLFIYFGQSYFGREWIFGGSEPKILAYIFVISSVYLACKDRNWLLIFSLVLATYFHFLVGGFWTLAIFVLLIIRNIRARKTIYLFMVYTISISPIFLILIFERLNNPVGNIADLEYTLNEIYAVFRAPHHIAPFSSMDQIKIWLPGIAIFLTVLFVIIVAYRTQARAPKYLLLWVILLHLYLASALVVAFIDRNTHIFSQFYLFRPGSLTLLLLLMLGVSWLRESLAAPERPAIALLALIVAVPVLGTKVWKITEHAMTQPFFVSQNAFSSSSEVALVNWLQKNTEREDVVVLQPTQETRWTAKWIAFDQVIDRPTLVRFKFVPTIPNETVKWYRLIKWRSDVFSGNCERITEQPVAYLVTVDSLGRQSLEKCGLDSEQFGSLSVFMVE